MKNGDHNNLVVRIMDALQNATSGAGEEGNHDGSSDRVESDEDMTLVQFQKEAKAEVMGRRGVAKADKIMFFCFYVVCVGFLGMGLHLV